MKRAFQLMQGQVLVIKLQDWGKGRGPGSDTGLPQLWKAASALAVLQSSHHSQGFL